jgi:hypothetical protein
MAVVAIPADFDRVKEIAPATGGVKLTAANGRQAQAALDLSWLELKAEPAG